VPNVFSFKTAVERRRAAKLKKEQEAKAASDEPDGLIQFTCTAGRSRMIVRGVYADRLQSGMFTLIKGLNDLADRIAESGGAGHYATDPINDAIAAPPCTSRLPRRLREATGFGEL
jgi:hypothetical protein